MFHIFDKQIQLYPALAAEHAMLSIAEGAPAARIVVGEKKIAIAPLDIAIFATSLLGTLYYWLSQQSYIKRIVYIRSDSSVADNTLVIPQSTGVKQVLGKTIRYADAYTLFGQSLLSSQFCPNDAYFVNSSFWYAHTHYASFLNKVELCPLVFSQQCSPDSFFTTLSQDVLLLPDTFFIMSDDFRFKMQDNAQGSHIFTLKQEHYNRFDLFCAHCDIQKLLPTIMRVELLEHNELAEDKIYQGILLA